MGLVCGYADVLELKRRFTLGAVFLTAILASGASAGNGRWYSSTKFTPPPENQAASITGFIIPSVVPAPGGAKLTVDIYYAKYGTPVSLELEGVVNDGANQLKTIRLQLLTDFVNDNPNTYHTRREFNLDYAKLNEELHKQAPEAPGLVLGPGSPLFVKGLFRGVFKYDHESGGPAQAGIFYLPVPKDGRGAEKRGGVAPGVARADTLDVAQTIDQDMVKEFNTDNGAKGVKLNGQLKSRLEGEGKYQVPADRYAQALKLLFELADSQAKVDALLGTGWTITLKETYLKKDAAGKVVKDVSGYPIPDPMIDTYYDNENYDAAKHDMALRYRWTGGNSTGEWNFKPSMGMRSANGTVYRIEYGLDTTDDKPETILKFAESAHPLNFFRLIPKEVPGTKATDFLKPALQITDTRFKFNLKNQQGLTVEISLDDVHAEALRGVSHAKEGHFYQLEMELDHLGPKSGNVQNSMLNPNSNFHNYGLNGPALETYLKGLGAKAFFDGRPVIHVPEDIQPDSPVRTIRGADFNLSDQISAKVRTYLLGADWIPGGQKYAFAAYATGIVTDKTASPSVLQTVEQEFAYRAQAGGGARQLLGDQDPHVRVRAAHKVVKEIEEGKGKLTEKDREDRVRDVAPALAALAKDPNSDTETQDTG